DFLSARYKPEVMRELAGNERGFTDAQWHELVELGWPGVIVPEEHGGLGLGAVELVVIAEEMGYALAPSPLHSDVCAALLLSAAGTDEQRGRWLEPLASGQARGSLAVWDEQSGWAPDHSELESTSGALTGTKIAVPDAASADFLIVSGADQEHYLVEAGADGIEITSLPGLDPTRKLYRVSFHESPAQALSARASERINHAYATIVTSLAAENVGVAQRTMEM